MRDDWKWFTGVLGAFWKWFTDSVWLPLSIVLGVTGLIVGLCLAFTRSSSDGSGGGRGDRFDRWVTKCQAYPHHYAVNTGEERNGAQWWICVKDDEPWRK